MHNIRVLVARRIVRSSTRSVIYCNPIPTFLHFWWWEKPMKWSEATVKKIKKKKWSEASVGQLGHREYRQLAVSLSLLRTQTRCLAFSEKLADRSERLADSRSLFLPSSWASRQLDRRWIFLEVFEIPFGTLRNANWLQARHFQIQRMLISESTWNSEKIWI